MASARRTGRRLPCLAALVTAVATGCQANVPGSVPESLSVSPPTESVAPSVTASIALAPSSSTASVEPPCIFGPPENLGATINTAGFDGGPAVSSDGRDLYLVSDRAGGNGGGDLWVARRPSPDAPFEPPVNLGIGVNAAANEGAPTLSSDGLTILFDRDDGAIWSASRPSVSDPFGPATQLGPPVASPLGAGFPALVPDGRTLYFASNRPDGEGGLDIWLATRDASSGPFAAASNLGPTVNLASADAMPAISPDGLLLAFASRRDGGQGDWDIWLSARPSVDADFEAPVNAGTELNTAGFEGRPAFDADGSTLYFMSDRSGGRGAIDIWRAAMDCA